MIMRMIAVALALFLAFDAAPRAEPIMRPPPPVEVRVRPGVTVKYLALRPKTEPRNTVILFAGGDGLLNLQADGSIGTNLSGNFLVRSRDRFARRNLFVAAVDTPNQVAIDGNVRLSAQYAQDIGRVIEDVRTRIATGGKVWLVGTSSGTLSAVGVAAWTTPSSPPIRVNVRRPDGIVLTATQTNRVKGLCGRTVFNAALPAIGVPALVAHHLGDRCRCSPPKFAGKVVAALTGAPAKEHKTFSGGLPPKSPGPCLAFTPHGFFGIEDQVVGAIADFIRKH